MSYYDMLPWLSNTAFASAVLLMFLTMWHWYDSNEDWRSTKIEDPESANYKQARGSMRLAWLRVTSGVLWLMLAASLIWTNTTLAAATPIQARVWSRGIVLVMIWLEVIKLATDRITRHEVDAAVKRLRRSTP